MLQTRNKVSWKSFLIDLEDEMVSLFVKGHLILQCALMSCLSALNNCLCSHTWVFIPCIDVKAFSMCSAKAWNMMTTSHHSVNCVQAGCLQRSVTTALHGLLSNISKLFPWDQVSCRVFRAALFISWIRFCWHRISPVTPVNVFRNFSFICSLKPFFTTRSSWCEPHQIRKILPWHSFTIECTFLVHNQS